MENQDRPATKADLTAMKAELKALFEGKIDAAEERILDRVTGVVRDAETRMLQAFYGYAETNDRRITQGEAAATVVASRLATLEGRVLVLEKRLNIPPAT